MSKKIYVYAKSPIQTNFLIIKTLTIRTNLKLVVPGTPFNLLPVIPRELGLEMRLIID